MKKHFLQGALLGCLFMSLGIGAGVAASGCAALSKVTPAERATAYAGEAKALQAVCDAYRFDSEAGLTDEVPELEKLCP